VKHRCPCHQPESKLHKFWARRSDPQPPPPHWQNQPFKRGVPPQIKRKERALLRKHYKHWYSDLVEQYGEVCLNCGEIDDLAIDHILPIAKGGKSEYSNLQLLCRTCNTFKGKLAVDCRDK